MKKVIFVLAATIGGLCVFQASAQVSISLKIGTPVYCPPPAKVVVAPLPPPKVIAVKPVSVVVVPVRRRVVMRPPVYVVARPARKVVIYH